ncbi:MAG: nuclear transport factor 2 family protein [Acidobacteriota bacterium]|nr:nuclear transport factor 2 family protein [Acidobacteriota bacterium]
MPAHSPEELDQLFSEALNAGDLDALVALYEPQAVFVSEPGQTVAGTAAIREVLGTFVSMNPKITMDV